MNSFTIFPAIDLRGGNVVRLEEGDPARETLFSPDPVEVANRFLSAGARWLHLINLDGAFGDESTARKNETAILKILEIAFEFGGQIQVGGGIRSERTIDRLLAMGVKRVILGTLAFQAPELVAAALLRWGDERIAVSMDLRHGKIQTHGWQKTIEISPDVWIGHLTETGLRWVILTDVERDGRLGGANLDLIKLLPEDDRLHPVLAGGVGNLNDIRMARQAGFAGVIIGRALYTGELNLRELIKEVSNAG